MEKQIIIRKKLEDEKQRERKFRIEEIEEEHKLITQKISHRSGIKYNRTITFIKRNGTLIYI